MSAVSPGFAGLEIALAVASIGSCTFLILGALAVVIKARSPHSAAKVASDTTVNRSSKLHGIMKGSL